MEFSDHNSHPPSTPTDKTVVKDEPLPSPAAALEESSELKEKAIREGDAMVENKLDATDTAFKHSHSPTIVVTAGTETDESVKEDDGEEDRENLSRFTTWGTPNARNKPSEFNVDALVMRN